MADAICDAAAIIDGDKSDDPPEAERIRRLVAIHGAPLLILDCEAVRRQYRALQAALPGVDLHYALKPLPHPAVVTTLMAEDAWFDLATSGEVDLVASLGVSPERCIHTHPIKRDRDIRDALDFGVTTFVADNPDELRKFEKYADQAELLLRVSFRSPDAKVDLSKKFGCTPEAARDLLVMANELGIRIKGLFHHDTDTDFPLVGSHGSVSCTGCHTGRSLASAVVDESRRKPSSS